MSDHHLRTTRMLGRHRGQHRKVYSFPDWSGLSSLGVPCSSFEESIMSNQHIPRSAGDQPNAMVQSRFFAANEATARARGDVDWRLERLIDRLPKRVRSTVRLIQKPSARWVRITAGISLTFGGVLGFLPVLGFWMLPLGLALLAEDVQILRSLRSRILDWVEHHHSDWLGHRPRSQ